MLRPIEAVHNSANARGSRYARWAVPALVTAGVLAANSVAGYLIPGRQLAAAGAWPEPLGWFTRVLAVESWPTGDGFDVRWVVWAIVSAALLVTALLTPREAEASPSHSGAVVRVLGGAGAILLGLVAVRSVFSAVPLVAWMWTWQLALAVLWMVALYMWTVRLSVRPLARAVGLAVALLSGLSVLFVVQSQETYPSWPTGNVLFLTTACLVGVFLLGGWAWERLLRALRTGRVWDYSLAMGIASLAGLVMITLSMAGRRSAVLGLAAGVLYITVLWLLQPVDVSRRGRFVRLSKRAVLGILLVVMVTAGVAGARLLHSGRWESVQYRLALYEQTLSAMHEDPASRWIGFGPGHLVFELTARMRPLHAESPRIFHGLIADHAHSEPLQAAAELGLPLGLLYVLLPLGGLVGFVAAYRRNPLGHDRLTILGAGAALAASLAAETTSLGMRSPGTAMLVWALAGMGWGSGACAGGFGAVARWFGPAMRRASTHVAATTVKVVGIVLSLAVVVLAWVSMLASGHLYQAREAWSNSRYVAAARLLSRAALVPTGSAWMEWQSLQGRTEFALSQLVTEPAESQQHRAIAVALLGQLIRVCPAYVDTPVWLAWAEDDAGRARSLCEHFLQYDPYSAEARMLLASQRGVGGLEQLRLLRPALRNASVNPRLARMIVEAAQDGSSQPQLTEWMTAAQAALWQKDPARWSDPLALETLRLLTVVAAQQGRLAEAQERSNQAMSLVEALASDAWRNRLETVQMEVVLDMAWFGWLNQPEEAQRHARALDAYLAGQWTGATDTFSQRMAAQLAAILWLSQGSVERARQALFRSDPTIRPETMKMQEAQAWARLVSLMESRVAPATAEMWARHGRQLLGDAGWQRSLELSRARGAAPWWFGVLQNE